MVKTPKVRHSRSRREPVTIDLGPDDVTRVTDDATASPGNGPNVGTASAPDMPDDAEVTETAPAGDAAEQQEMRAPDADFEPWEHDESAAAAASETSETVADDADRPGTVEASAEADASSATASHRDHQYNFDEPPRSAATAGEATTGNTHGADDKTWGAPAGSPQPRRSGLGLVAAGIVGGVIALAGAGALQYAGLIGNTSNHDDLESQISALKGQLASIDLGSLNNASAKVGELSTALDQTRQDLVALKNSVGQGGDQTAVAGLDDRLKQVEAAVAALNHGGTGTPVDLGPVNDKLASLDGAIKAATDAATRQDQRVSALEQSVNEIKQKVDAQASQPKVALAIAASALKAALDRGGPFSAELDTFAAISPDAPQIAALRPYAEKGVPTRADIAGEVDAAASAMVAASAPVDPNAGFFQRLLSSAESLVKVRPIGAVEGTGVPETVARMEAAVTEGDYPKALAEYDSMPDAVKAAGADFAGKLKDRLDAEAQVDALVSGAMKA